MILVSVSKKHPAYLLAVCLKIRHIGDNKVNARHFVVGKSETAIHDYHIVFILKHGYIFAHLVKSAKRDYLKLSRRKLDLW